ncbi:FkbM family methyltransferase, partial [Dolichospermum sp. ST_sed3]|nr:FkbM family methyltransferase [Dolichospermum sp. ST_sed3]
YFDVGSNIGLLAIPILSHNPTCTVISIEPSPNSLPFLTHTIKKSNFSLRWYLIPKAAGDVVGSSPFTVTSSGDGAFDGFKSTRRGGMSHEILMQVTTIDTEWELLGEPDVSVIKIDIEGPELKVMQGAMKCIKKKRPYILTEWNKLNFKTYGNESEDLLNFSKDIDYKLYSLPFLVPVENRNVLEIQMLKTEYFLLAP